MNRIVDTASSAARRYATAILMLLGLTMALPTCACTVSSTLAPTLGTYSPAAVRAGAVPAIQTLAGLTCPTAVLTLLGGNYLRATITSQNALSFRQQGGAASIGYIASADAAGTYRFGQGTTIDYMQNNLLKALGLLGGSSASLPIAIRPIAGGTTVPAGVYTDRLTVDWTWYQCPGIGVLGACVGTIDQGAGRSTIDMTLLVTPQGVILTLGSVVTWDPVNGTSNPHALPGSRLRTSIQATNPDIVPLDANSLALVIPASALMIVALDGDGTGSATIVRLVDGSPASGVTLTYAGPADTTDDVDFSADGGASWAYAPVAGDMASEAAVTHVRLRPRGIMARQSAFSISLPFLVR